MKSQPALEAIRRLDGPPPKRCVDAAAHGCSGGAERLERMRPPADLRTDARAAGRRVAVRRNAVNGRYEAARAGQRRRRLGGLVVGGRRAAAAVARAAGDPRAARAPAAAVITAARTTRLVRVPDLRAFRQRGRRPRLRRHSLRRPRSPRRRSHPRGRRLPAAVDRERRLAGGRRGRPS